MGTRYWLQVGLMCLSFVAVVWVIQNLRTNGLGKQTAEAIGSARNARVSPTRIDLCQTRVQGLKTASGIELYENGMHWYMKKNENERKLDAVAVEKWFGSNCSVYAENLRPIASNDLQAAKPVLMLNFIQGGAEAVKKTPAGEFIWKQISFRSTQLEQALEQLPDLKDAPPRGRTRK